MPVRTTIASGVIPIERSSRTLCCVGRAEMRQQREVREHHVFVADDVAHLADRFEKRQRFDVADRAADLDQTYVRAARLGRARDVRLDLVGDVRDHLNGRTEVVAAALLLDDRLVDLTRRDVIVAGERLVDESLVVAEVEVGLGAVVGDEDFTMLERVHRAGVDVDVGIQFLDRNADAAGFQQPAERRGRYPLT